MTLGLKRAYNEITTNLKRDATKRNACTRALTGYDAQALSVPVQRPGLTRRWAEGPANESRRRMEGGC